MFKGRRAAVATGVLAMATVLWAGIAFKERIREEWYLRQLRSRSYEERIHAIEMLGKMRSKRAVPHLRRMIPARCAFSDPGRQLLATMKALGLIQETSPEEAMRSGDPIAPAAGVNPRIHEESPDAAP